MVSSRVFKEGFERMRPCRDPFFFDHVRLLVKHCSGGYSFTSSHAANHFGMATYVSITFYPTFKKWIYLTYIWVCTNLCRSSLPPGCAGRRTPWCVGRAFDC
jgi:undecaprenyl-diphosphatase